MSRWRCVVLAAVLGYAGLLRAEVPGARALEIGVTASNPAGGSARTTMYYLVGEAGARETYTLRGVGSAELAFFGPDGSQILARSGQGEVTLEVVLPFTDVFTLAVMEASPGRAYTLARAATVPTPTEVEMAANTGYSANGSPGKCWLVPGVKQRIFRGKDFAENTLSADRLSAMQVFHGADGKITATERRIIVRGADFHRIVHFQDGRPDDDLVMNDEFFLYDPVANRHFTGYLCDG